MTSYFCETCQKAHQVYAGLVYPPPQFINGMTETERAERVRDFDDILFVDGLRIFAKGNIYIYLEGQEAPFFSWETWVEVDTLEMQAKYPELQAGHTITVKGKVPSIPLLYDVVKELTCSVTLFPDETSSDITITEYSAIQRDQDEPITLDRVKELMNYIHHGRENVEERTDTKPFKERLQSTIHLIKSTYLHDGRDYGLSFHAVPPIGFQVVSSAILEATDDDAAGFGLHLPFDDDEKVMNQLLSRKDRDEYHLHVWDGIPTYQRDIGLDEALLLQLIPELLTEVFAVDLTTVNLEVFEM